MSVKVNVIDRDQGSYLFPFIAVVSNCNQDKCLNNDDKNTLTTCFHAWSFFSKHDTQPQSYFLTIFTILIFIHDNKWSFLVKLNGIGTQWGICLNGSVVPKTRGLQSAKTEKACHISCSAPYKTVEINLS